MPEHKKLPLGVGFRQGAHPLSARPFLSGNGSTLQRTAADAHEPHTQSLQRTSPRLAPELPQAESTVQATYMTALAALNPLLPAPPTSSTYHVNRVPPGLSSSHTTSLASRPDLTCRYQKVLLSTRSLPAIPPPPPLTKLLSLRLRQSRAPGGSFSLRLSAARSPCLRPR